MRGYTGEIAGVSFEDGVPVKGSKQPTNLDSFEQSLVGYMKRHGLGIEDDRLVVLDGTVPQSADPRDIGTKGDGIEPVGTKLRDAAVDPRASDFLAPTNAGQANPHGPDVISPEIHGSPSRAVTPGPVPRDPAVQDAKETAAAVEARTDDAPARLTVDPDYRESIQMPKSGDNKAAWVEYATALGALDAEDRTKAELIGLYGPDAEATTGGNG